MATHRRRSGAGDPVPEDSLKPSHVDPPKAPHTPAPRRAASARPVSPAVASPQIGRLERDDQLEQLADQAQDVLSSEDRLRGLLAAT